MHFLQLALAACLSLTAVQAMSPERLEARDAYFSYLKRATGKNTTLEAGGATRKTSLRSQCSELDRLQGLVKLAANSTRLSETEERRNLTGARLTQFQEQLTAAPTRLAALQSNSTLTADCAVLRAHNKFVSQCHDITNLQDLVKLSTNETALRQAEERRNLTAAGIARFTNQTRTAATRLAALTANATLAESCAVFTAHDKLVSQCRELDQLTQLSRFTGNATLVAEAEAKRNMTAKEAGQLQQEIGGVKTRLAALSGNSTLVADCKVLTAASGMEKNGKVKGGEGV